MKPKPDKAQNATFHNMKKAYWTCSSLLSNLSKFDKWPHPVRPKTKIYFHVRLGFYDPTKPALPSNKYWTRCGAGWRKIWASS